LLVELIFPPEVLRGLAEILVFASIFSRVRGSVIRGSVILGE
jgi:hypothetical protein